MKREDYRYGNLMQDRIGRICRIEGITKDGVDIRAIDYPITGLPCEPIPITEEWLLKFGFEKIFGDEINYHFDWWNKDEFDEGFLWQHDLGFCYNFGRGHDLEFVHQLQNLYYALTGEELTLKK